jgi:serine protease AprX
MAAVAVGLLATTTLIWSAASGSAAPAKKAPPGDPGSSASPTPSVPDPSTTALGYSADDPGAPSAITRMIGAQDAWAAGWTGRGVDVAVIDTGVARVPGLDAPGKVLDGPDLSLDAPNDALRGVDAYGHGTFMAGLVAGRDAGVEPSAAGCAACLNGSGFSDPGRYVGVAPEARIVNVKVGAADGAVDVSQVIAALHWVTQHAHDPGLNIRVISLSFGTDTNQHYDRDPLAHAAEQAWKQGIVVVAAAGNDGRGPGKVAAPAYDPFVVAAGADDPMSTLPTADDRVPDFAQHGTRQRPVDVVAPGTHTIGLRVPGSYVDRLADNAGRLGDRFQRGSGTSESAAVVAGAAALLVQRYPSATPDTIKGLLNGSARLLPRQPGKDQTAELYSGNGIVDVAGALARPPAPDVQTWQASTGDGKLDASRAGAYVDDGGEDLRGEQDIFGRPFDARATAAKAERGKAWDGGEWNGSRWTGDGWSGSRWTGSRWTGTDWAGSRWTGSRWTGMKWDGSRWTGDGWTGSRWTGSRWTGLLWSTAGWS